jgi:6-phosphofructokinase 1
VGVPKTIDNDLSSTDYTFGFDTALNTAMECIDKLHTTAESHHRIIVVEVMGRHAGWIAAYSGIAGGADYILVPEIPIDLGEVCASIKKRHERGKNFSIIVVSEGAAFKDTTLFTQEQKLDEFGHVRLGGIGDALGRLIEERTGFETRVTVLGHIQRGGSPTAFDRVLGTRFGIKAYGLVRQGKFNRMVSLRGNEIVDVALAEATGKLKTLDLKLYEVAKIFFG